MDNLPTLEEWLRNNRTNELEAVVRDAERYRWLRAQQWDVANLFVIAGSKSQVRLGTDCPSLDRLDEAIDAQMSGEKS